MSLHQALLKASNIYFELLSSITLLFLEGASAAQDTKAAVPEVKKTIFNVVLADVSDMDKNKLKVIKAIRGVKPEESLMQVSVESEEVVLLVKSLYFSRHFISISFPSIANRFLSCFLSVKNTSASFPQSYSAMCRKRKQRSLRRHSRIRGRSSSWSDGGRSKENLSSKPSTFQHPNNAMRPWRIEFVFRHKEGMQKKIKWNWLFTTLLRSLPFELLTTNYSR